MLLPLLPFTAEHDLAPLELRRDDHHRRHYFGRLFQNSSRILAAKFEVGDGSICRRPALPKVTSTFTLTKTRAGGEYDPGGADPWIDWLI